jgi:hypothetical protein
MYLAYILQPIFLWAYAALGCVYIVPVLCTVGT